MFGSIPLTQNLYYTILFEVELHLNFSSIDLLKDGSDIHRFFQ